jgi:adenylosuccinate lyase
MAKIWSDEQRLALWLEVEVLALEGMAREGLVPDQAVTEAKKCQGVDVARVLEIEQEVKHDVIAFLTAVAEKVGPSARFMHRGMTSNDMLDTTFAVQLRRSGKLILEGLDKVRAVLKLRAKEFEGAVCMGRTHGMHAEPVTFGLKLAGWYAELGRARRRLESAISEVSVGKLSGAVGTYASLPPSVEKHVMSSLGLEAETVATQVVARDRHANFFGALALLGASLERFCVEIRHLQRTEVNEAEEPFGSGQKGSSAMPHKKNPILSENLVGMARLLRGYAVSALENVALWHERDISHSSVERVIGPDACILTDFMLNRFRSIVEGLVVHPERMMQNLEATNGIAFSGSLLIALADAGVKREEAYRLVQRHALEAGKGGPALKTRVEGDPEITKLLSPDKLSAVFDLKKHLAHVGMIIERALHS